MISVGFIGFGLSGSVFHAPLLKKNPHYQIKAVVSSRKGEVLKQCPEAILLSSKEELLNIPEIELIIVATPNFRHFEDAKAALLANKHVVIEKPFAPTVLECEELIRLSQEKNRVLTIFHNRRWDGDFLTVRKIIKEKTLGEVFYFESHFDRFRPIIDARWKEKVSPGSGNFYDLGSHLIDQALQLFGVPDSIHSDLEKQRPGAQTTDYFQVVMKYGKCRVVLQGGSLVIAPTPRFQIHGTLASYVKYGFDPQEEYYKSGILRAVPDGVLTDSKGKLSTIPTLKGEYEKFYEMLFEAIRNRKAPPVDPAEALSVIEFIERSSSC